MFGCRWTDRFGASLECTSKTFLNYIKSKRHLRSPSLCSQHDPFRCFFFCGWMQIYDSSISFCMSKIFKPIKQTDTASGPRPQRPRQPTATPLSDNPDHEFSPHPMVRGFCGKWLEQMKFKLCWSYVYDTIKQTVWISLFLSGLRKTNPSTQKKECADIHSISFLLETAHTPKMTLGATVDQKSRTEARDESAREKNIPLREERLDHSSTR